MIPQSTKRFRYFTYIEPVLKTPLIRTYGSVIFTIVALIVFILFAIKPTVQTIVVLQKTQENQKEVLQKIGKKSQDLSLAQNNFKSIDEVTKEKIKTAIPTSLQLGTLISSLENSTQNTTASVSAIQFQPISVDTAINPDPKIQEIEFTLNIQGNYGALKTVLDNLRASSRVLIIDKLSFNKIEDGSGLIMTIAGKGYYLR